MKKETNTAIQLSYQKLSTHKGAKRLWLQGLRLLDAGYAVGASYTIVEDQTNRTMKLVLDEKGPRKVSRKVQGETIYPVIDINNKALVVMFGESIDRVRVIIGEGYVLVTAHPDDVAKIERIERICRKLNQGLTLDIGSVCHGIGVMDHAIHQGLLDQNIPSRLAWGIDVEQTYLQASLENNQVWDRTSLVVNSTLEQVEPALLSVVELVCAGLPCVGASRSGKARNNIQHAEQHETAGTAFIPFLMYIKKCNPACIVLENVVDYFQTMSYHVIKTVLDTWGYVVHEEVVDRELGAFEDRKRQVMVAITEGLPFNFNLLPAEQGEEELSEILEDIPLDSPLWKEYSYLDKKQERDLQENKGFKMQVLSATAKKVGVVTRGYAKVRSTDVLIQHPTNPKLRRQLTVLEHSRVKKVPTCLTQGMSKTRAHEGLGQSVLYPAFRSVGRTLGQHFWKYAKMAG